MLRALNLREVLRSGSPCLAETGTGAAGEGRRGCAAAAESVSTRHDNPETAEMLLLLVVNHNSVIILLS